MARKTAGTITLTEDVPPGKRATQELFLPVHGHVVLYPEEIAIIDHPAFQRLRRVRQLGFAHVVFPGGTHTRFEHSIGAVHVAQLIISNVNANCERANQDSSVGDWRLDRIDEDTARLIRLGALLHDIGHVPIGHTLEDELNHLRSHDGQGRLQKVGSTKQPHYNLDKSVDGSAPKPEGGWSLSELINALYSETIHRLSINLDPYVVLCQIICKPPKDNNEVVANWKKDGQYLEKLIKLKVCQDIVGNTICADFLDYLFRDWYHIGKPLYEDKRLYQYMEVRTPVNLDNTKVTSFVINVGSEDKIRHDALTSILELLEGRYKLAETVLFHRTKLAVTALLDRCMSEIRDLYGKVGISDEYFLDTAEDYLLSGSDDEIPEILEKLAYGGNDAGRALIAKKRELEIKKLAGAVGAVTGNPDLLGTAQSIDGRDIKTGIDAQLELIISLIKRLRDRCVYTLGYKLRISDIPGAHTPENPKLKKLISTYLDSRNRHAFLRGMEALCRLPPCSLIMYCPPNAAMNAKIAKVNLLIEGEVTPFNQYENEHGEANLTRGALTAQVKRFYELWSAQIFVDRSCWDALSSAGKQNLRAALKEFFFLMRPDISPSIVREQVETSVKVVQAQQMIAARGGSEAPELHEYTDFVFPSGLPFAG